MEHRSAQARINLLQLPHRVDAQLLLHIVPHLERDDLAAEAVHDWRHIQFPVCTLYLGNIREKFFQRAPGAEVPLQEVFLLLHFCRGLRDTVRNAFFVEPAILVHHAVHRSPADVDAVLLKREADAIHAVVAFAELPVPKQVSCNVAERSATLRMDNVSIDIYPQCGPEQLKTLVELLRTC